MPTVTFDGEEIELGDLRDDSPCGQYSEYDTEDGPLWVDNNTNEAFDYLPDEQVNYPDDE